MDDLRMDLKPALERLYGVEPDCELTQLAGDASTRSYCRMRVAGRDPEQLIVMRLPEDAAGSDEGAGGERPGELPFLDVQRLLSGRGIAVPHVYAADLGRRVVLLEDLGDETFEQRLGARGREAWPALYESAVELLATMHGRCAGPGASIAYARSFDQKLLRWELDHFRQWGLEAVHGVLSRAARKELDAQFDLVTERLLAMPQGFVHRDFQSRNLMWRGDGLVVIDFQDALQGPVPYDLVALLCDSYVALDATLQQAMISRYAALREVELDLGAFEASFWWVAVHRKLKDAGRFVFIDRERGNPAFLAWYGQSLAYVGQALARLPELKPLRRLLEDRIPGFPGKVAQPTARAE